MSRTQTKTPAGDPTPVTGGVPIPARLRRKLPDIPAASDPLDRHILLLFALHQDRLADLRPADLFQLDRAAKTKLLSQINQRLGIRPNAPD
jgi:hypothetical protein